MPAKRKILNVEDTPSESSEEEDNESDVEKLDDNEVVDDEDEDEQGHDQEEGDEESDVESEEDDDVDGQCAEEVSDNKCEASEQRPEKRGKLEKKGGGAKSDIRKDAEKYSEQLARRGVVRVSLLIPLLTWFSTFFCGVSLLQIYVSRVPPFLKVTLKKKNFKNVSICHGDRAIYF